MARFFRQPGRRQRHLSPVDMVYWLPKGDIVHLIVDAVGLMDLSGFEAAYRIGGAGQPPFAPEVLLTLLIYAYSHGRWAGCSWPCWSCAGRRDWSGSAWWRWTEPRCGRTQHWRPTARPPPLPSRLPGCWPKRRRGTQVRTNNPPPRLMINCPAT